MRKQYQLIVLFMLFAAPPVAAYLYFFVYDGSFSAAGAKTANFGELVVPARPIESVELATVDGEGFAFSDLYGKWTLLYIGGTACDPACAEHLYNIHQVRLAQGKDRGRVTSVYVLPRGGTDELITQARKRLPDMTILLASPDVYAKLTRQFELDGAAAHTGERVYIIDPLGNLMMSYPNGADPSNIRKDLKKLLKISQIG